ncbi:unnamed protein product [Schistosoma curassoni]|uniref:Secreted protein n=1 Tax=Schistosoma curassoni TaxID=6186 RepID=A0A183JTF1_9TREM|nr:unnamed protein product [Schistosoma curassoni]
MFFNCIYAALALPIRAFTSASDLPCSSMMLPKYVKVVIGLLHAVLYRRILLFPLCMLRPTAVEVDDTLVVFF